MVIKEKQIFNLMDTNGRRNDVLNALKVYLEILTELHNTFPTESWSTYPASLSQFLFYEKALDKSKEVFKKHSHYDDFIQELGQDRPLFLRRDQNWINQKFPQYARVLDEAIEKRARHYTSNLVKMGFSNERREITPAGYDFLKGSITRDSLESLLPLDDVNIVLLRQLAKLRIFSGPNQGKRSYYAPFFMALFLLLQDFSLDSSTFEVVIQGLSPYTHPSIKEAVCSGSISLSQLEEEIRDIPVSLPAVLRDENNLDYLTFQTIFKGSKNNASLSKTYYDFYLALKQFREEINENSYTCLLECLDGENTASLNKAFGYGKSIFNAGNRGHRYSLEKFWEQNKDHPLLATPDFLQAFYAAFVNSKWLDGIREYSDTTIRLLSATGLFKFKNLPQLAYKKVLSLIFDSQQLQGLIFGNMTEEEYLKYESCDNYYFGQSISLIQILGYSHEDTRAITQKVQVLLGVRNDEDVKKHLDQQKNTEFIQHIHTKYSRDKILKLLPLFSDRKNDSLIKKEVNDSATVPTIYEYIVGIAWYYISREEFDLYSSLNLTLNADFEPVLHAGGGDGDIVIQYRDFVVMLEATLMNKQAQKRGEWEPVLRHTLNLKAACEPKETITFFIADELDYNTINIWRAVAAVALESTNTHTRVDGVVIMPFTNRELVCFLKENVYYRDIILAVKDSFDKLPRISDLQWQEDILKKVLKN